MNHVLIASIVKFGIEHSFLKNLPEKSESFNGLVIFTSEWISWQCINSAYQNALWNPSKRRKNSDSLGVHSVVFLSRPKVSALFDKNCFLNFHSKKEENAQLPKSNFWISEAAKDHFGESSTMLSEVIQTLPLVVVCKSQFLHHNSPLIPKLFLSQTPLLPPHSFSQTFIPSTPRSVTRLADSLSQCFDAAIAPERSFLLPVLLWCDSRAVLHAGESQN